MRLTPEIIAETPDDALSVVLESVRLRSHFFGFSELTEPWGMEVGPRSSIIFHVQLTGAAYLDVANGRDSVQLQCGDVALLPHGTHHCLRSTQGATCIAIEQLIANAKGSRILQHGGGGPMAQFLCGGFELEDWAANPLLRSLPDLILIPAAEREPWLETTLQFIGNEAAHAHSGSAAVIRRLADVLLIQCLRHFARNKAETESGQSWIRGLQDARLSRALTAIHRNPEISWTVAELAAEAGLSRSGFASLFTSLLGETPASYLTRWRMHHASKLLRQTRLGLSEISVRSGYESEAAFSRVFRRHRGISPGRYRRSALTEVP